MCLRRLQNVIMGLGLGAVLPLLGFLVLMVLPVGAAPICALRFVGGGNAGVLGGNQSPHSWRVPSMREVRCALRG